MRQGRRGLTVWICTSRVCFLRYQMRHPSILHPPSVHSTICLHPRLYGRRRRRQALFIKPTLRLNSSSTHQNEHPVHISLAEPSTLIILSNLVTFDSAPRLLKASVGCHTHSRLYRSRKEPCTAEEVVCRFRTILAHHHQAYCRSRGLDTEVSFLVNARGRYRTRQRSRWSGL